MLSFFPLHGMAGGAGQACHLRDAERPRPRPTLALLFLSHLRHCRRVKGAAVKGFAMKYGLEILKKLGLLAHKDAQVHPRFDQRLQRMGAREQARQAQLAQPKPDIRNPHGPRAV